MTEDKYNEKVVRGVKIGMVLCVVAAIVLVILIVRDVSVTHVTSK